MRGTVYLIKKSLKISSSSVPLVWVDRLLKCLQKSAPGRQGEGIGGRI